MNLSFKFRIDLLGYIRQLEKRHLLFPSEPEHSKPIRVAAMKQKSQLHMSESSAIITKLLEELTDHLRGDRSRSEHWSSC